MPPNVNQARRKAMSVVENEVARSVAEREASEKQQQEESAESTGDAAASSDPAAAARAAAVRREAVFRDAANLKGRQENRQARHAALHDAVKAVVIWVVLAMLYAGMVWTLAHVTVSHRPRAWAVSLGWALTGFTPVCVAERLLQRTAAGIKLQGISGAGHVPLCPSTPLPALIVLPLLPGAPWFGPSRAARWLAAAGTGVALVTLERMTAPFYAAIAGCVLALLLVIRASHAAIWICEWRIQQIWRKKK
eukprot:TRINITY_DN7668_c0_g3_i1.p1 TRINITY_DN7668_c0_g3~~TRINITY_DN7668_c0_g3_i1.p1  ORF type:complete len:250 (-),score=63.67 TRINITY_DN7668_c0_g3_i1:41-790(-)